MYRLKNSITYGVVYAFAAYFLYKSYLASIFIFFVFFTLRMLNKSYFIKKKKKKMLLDFYDFLICLTYQFNYVSNYYNGFKQAYSDYIKIYGENIFSNILKQAINVKAISQDEKSYLIYIKDTINIEEVSDFINSTLICLSMGNDISNNIKNSVLIIKEKIETEQNIEILITQKKTEQLIVSIIPFVIIAIFSLTASDYLNVMYTTLIGKLVMTVAGILFIIQKMIGNKIVSIEV